MRALCVLVAWFVAVAPSQAFVRVMGSHPAGVAHGHRHGGQRGLGDFGGAYGPDYLPAIPPADETASAPVYLSPALRCPAIEPAATTPRPGPHIIYIGHQPTISGPKVIYGTGSN